MTEEIPAAVVSAYQISPGAAFEPVASGLINSTWLVRDGAGGLVLQKLNHIFDASVNAKIAEVTAFLSSGPAGTTRLLKTASDALQVMVGEDCWRCLDYLPGSTYDRITDLKLAQVAGRALGDFHAAMQEYPASEHLPILTVHDLGKHTHTLIATMQAHANHPRYSIVSRAADEILNAIESLPELVVFPLANVHGDPKITNFIFEDTKSTACLIDLDTIGRGQVLHELGDAFRSWCNPQGEECENASFELEIFVPALTAYLQVAGIPLNVEQSKYIGIAIEMICLELAARFCADALNESYFAWDSQRYASAGEHQLVRARGQLNLAKSVIANRQQILHAVETAWG